MNDPELEDLFNRAFTTLFPEVFRVLWDEQKEVHGRAIEDVSIC